MLQKSYIFLFIVYFFPTMIWADLAILNDGSRLSGYYLKETENGILFKTLNGEEKEILKTELKKLEVGYNGSKMCITTKNNNKPNCDVLFYKMDEKRILIAEGEGFLKLRSIPVSEVAQFELRKDDNRPKQLASKMPRDQNLEFRYDGKKIKGKVISQNENEIKIKTKNGKIKNLQADKITAAVFKPEAKRALFDVPLRYLYPGVYQYEQKNIKTGYALGGSFAISIVGFIYEYQAAVNAAAGAASDPSVILFNNDSYLAEFNRAQNMQKIFFAIATSLFIYNILDYLYFDSNENLAHEKKDSDIMFYFSVSSASDAFQLNQLYPYRSEAVDKTVQAGLFFRW